MSHFNRNLEYCNTPGIILLYNYYFSLCSSLFLCTGKEAKNATLSHGVVMCQAIKYYHDKTGYKVYYNFIIIVFMYVES